MICRLAAREGGLLAWTHESTKDMHYIFSLPSLSNILLCIDKRIRGRSIIGRKLQASWVGQQLIDAEDAGAYHFDV